MRRSVATFKAVRPVTLRRVNRIKTKKKTHRTRRFRNAVRSGSLCAAGNADNANANLFIETLRTRPFRLHRRRRHTSSRRPRPSVFGFRERIFGLKTTKRCPIKRLRPVSTVCEPTVVIGQRSEQIARGYRRKTTQTGSTAVSSMRDIEWK